MSTPNKFLTDAFQEISDAQRDVFSVMRDFNRRMPSYSAAEVAQAKRRLARAAAALSMLEETTGMKKTAA